MKKISIIASLLSFLTIHAQEVDFDYRPFIEQGKVWVSKPEINIHIEGDLFVDRAVVQYNYFQGDTVVQGKTCKRWITSYCDKKGNIYETYVTPMFEEDKKVWFYFRECDSPFLAYDFGAKVGDTIIVMMPYSRQYEFMLKYGRAHEFLDLHSDTLVILSKEVEEVMGQLRTKTYFTSARESYKKWQDANRYNYFLYGIGSHFIPDFNIAYTLGGNGSYWLMYCVVWDDILYADEEKATFWEFTCPTPSSHPELFGITSPITLPHAVNSGSTDSRYYDLSGRRLAAPPKKGMYILTSAAKKAL